MWAKIICLWKTQKSKCLPYFFVHDFDFVVEKILALAWNRFKIGLNEKLGKFKET